MITPIDTRILIEPLEDKKKFKVTFTRIDEAEPSDILKNMDQIEASIKDQEQFLAIIDKQIQVKKEIAQKDIEANKKLLNDFKAVEQKVKIWKNIADQEEKRRHGEKPIPGSGEDNKIPKN